MKKISLSKGLEAIVDDEDFESLSQYKWRFDGRYATRLGDSKKVYMHRAIAGNDSTLDTDHINRDKLDNRKSNLRICTRTVNNFNQPIRADNTSGYKGISWRKDSKKWRARVVQNGKEIRLGLFKDLREAIIARENYVKNIL